MELKIHTTHSSDFGPVFKAFRTTFGVTQRELASVAQISERHLRRIESGEYVAGVWMQFHLPNELGHIMGERYELRRTASA